MINAHVLLWRRAFNDARLITNLLTYDVGFDENKWKKKKKTYAVNW